MTCECLGYHLPLLFKARFSEAKETHSHVLRQYQKLLYNCTPQNEQGLTVFTLVGVQRTICRLIRRKSRNMYIGAGQAGRGHVSFASCRWPKYVGVCLQEKSRLNASTRRTCDTLGKKVHPGILGSPSWNKNEGESAWRAAPWWLLRMLFWESSSKVCGQMFFKLALYCTIWTIWLSQTLVQVLGWNEIK